MIRKWFTLKNLLRYLPLLLFFVILKIVDPKKVWAELVNMDLWLFLLALVLTFPLILCKAWRWQYLLKMQRIAYPLKDSFRAYVASLFLGNWTPGRVGDFLKVFYLTKATGVSLGKGFSSVLVDRILDLAVLMLLGGLGTVMFSMSKEMVMLLVFSLLALTVLAILVMSKRLSGPFLKLVFEKTFLKKSKSSAMTQFDDFHEGMEDLKKLRLMIPFIISVVSYVFFFASAYLIALALHFNVSLYYIVLCVTISNVVSVLPVSVSGVGTRDAVLIALFKVVPLTPQQAVSYSFMLLVVFSIVATVWGAWVWFKHPVDIMGREGEA